MDKNIIQEFFGKHDDLLPNYMKEFNITQKMLDDSVEQLKEWFKMQPHLPNVDLGNDYYIRSLCFSKFSIEKTKSKIENIFTARTVLPEYFSGVDPLSDEIKYTCVKYVQWMMLPNLNKNKERVIIARYKNTEESALFDGVKAHKYIFLVEEVRLSYETCFENVYIYDCAHMKLGHVLRHTPTLLKSCLFIAKSCHGARIKGIHCLNMPSYSIPLFNILKSLLTGKLMNRLFLHDSLDDLHKYVDKNILPEEYGGNFGTCDKLGEMLQDLIEVDECRNKILASQNHKSDESKRNSNTKGKFDELLGIDGSFRKLDID